MSRTILHCDMNNFYASVECFLDPKLKPFPVAVCGDVEERHGIVLAKNYKAKGYGVSTGEAIWQAKQKCPGLVVIPPHYEEYMKFSKAAREIYEHYTDQVEPFGMDECWLDVTGSTRIMGNGEKIANEIRERIKFELGLTISAGVSFNKIFAKLGSDMKKPDAVTVTRKTTSKTLFGIFRLPICLESEELPNENSHHQEYGPSVRLQSFRVSTFKESSESVVLIYGGLQTVLMIRE